MVECPVCNSEYSRIGTHWANGKCSVSLSEKQLQVSQGLLLGDGTLSQTGANPRLQVACVKKEYLEHLDDIFGVMSAGVYKHRTPEQLAENSNFEAEDFSETYMWQSRRSDAFDCLVNWYTPDKMIPESLELSPLTLKHWYCGDGTLHTQGHIRISATGFYDNKETVESLFTNEGLPSPSNWNTSSSSLVKKSAAIVFTKNDTRALFDYMGEPVIGYKYKWPDRQTS
jgi:hypothetical protein